MTYVLKFSYESDVAGETKTKFLCFSHEAEARRTLEAVSNFFTCGQPLTVQDNRQVVIFGVWFYWSNSDGFREAEDDVLAGTAKLLEVPIPIKVDIRR